MYRLTTASSTLATTTDFLRTYTYDALGNIQNKSDQGNYLYEGNTGTRYENPHAVTDINGTNYTYDSNGNLTSDSTWTYTWDYNNRMTQASGGGTTIDYEYDHTRQRTVYSDGTTTTVFANIYYNTDGTNKTKHIFAGNLLVATIVYDGATTTTHYVHTDHLTGTGVVTDENGDLEQLLDYYPFGDQRINSQQTSFDEKNKFTGHEHDSDTDLEYMKARYYNGDIGRFFSQDPAFQIIGDTKNFNGLLLRNKYIPKNSMALISSLGDTEKTNENILIYDYLTKPQALNSYSYVSNNPIIYTDPLGESETAEKIVNWFKSGEWKTDIQLTDISQIPTQLVSPETADREETFISSPEHASHGTLRAAGPERPSYNARKSISDGINSVSEGVDSVAASMETPGFAAGLTIGVATVVSPLGPQASAGVMVSYPAIETDTKFGAAAVTFISQGLGAISNWIIN